MRRIVRLAVGITLWILYELFLDGSGIGLKERWHRIRAWSKNRDRTKAGSE